MFFLFIFRKTLQLLKTRKLCHSALWVSFSEFPPCTHCMRLTVEGVTLEGQTKLDRNQDVDFELERQRIFQLYAGKSVLRKILFLENRVLESLGVPFLF